MEKNITTKFNRLNALCEIILDGLEDVIGSGGVNAVLNMTRMIGSQTDVPQGTPYPCDILSSLETIYGRRGGQGLSLQAGRASFTSLLKIYGDRLGTFDKNLLLLPAQQRLIVGLDKLAKVLNNIDDISVEVTEHEKSWDWSIGRCVACQKSICEKPICHFVTGLLQEYLACLSGGKYYQIREVECMESGTPSCLLRIDRVPLDV